MKKKNAGIPNPSGFRAIQMNNCTWPSSVKKAMDQYNTRQKAERFASAVIGTATDRREKRCITRALALANVPCGAHVLDLPCGAGRLLPLLKNLGYRVTAADVSIHMLTLARRYAGTQEKYLDEKDNFVVANVFQTGFKDNSFDAVICHRLLQYFPEPEVRRRALKELARISAGPIVVSFLCNLAVDVATSRVSDVIRRRKPRGCAPISYATFAEDVRAAGLVVKKWIPMRPLVSKRWYAVIERDTAVCNRTVNLRHTTPWKKLSRIASVAAVILIGPFLATRAKLILDPHEYEVEQIVKKYQDGNDHFYVSASSYLEDLSMGKNLSVLARITEAADKIAIDRAESEDSFFLVSYKDFNEMKKSPAWKQLSFVRRVSVCGERFVLLSTETSGTLLRRPRVQDYFFRLNTYLAFVTGPRDIYTACQIPV